MLTEQEVFDKVVERLEDGTGQSIEVNQVGESFCSYLDTKGNKCAVGIFLPDNKEMQIFKGCVYELIKIFKDHPEFPKEITEHGNLLGELQYAHDVCRNWNGKKFINTDLLKAIASDFNLKY